MLQEVADLDKDDSDDDDDDEEDDDENGTGAKQDKGKGKALDLSDADEDDDDSDDDDDDDDEDETAELLRELEKIQKERAEEKERQVSHATSLANWDPRAKLSGFRFNSRRSRILTLERHLACFAGTRTRRERASLARRRNRHRKVSRRTWTHTHCTSVQIADTFHLPAQPAPEPASRTRSLTRAFDHLVLVRGDLVRSQAEVGRRRHLQEPGARGVRDAQEGVCQRLAPDGAFPSCLGPMPADSLVATETKMLDRDVCAAWLTRRGR